MSNPINRSVAKSTDLGNIELTYRKGLEHANEAFSDDFSDYLMEFESNSMRSTVAVAWQFVTSDGELIPGGTLAFGGRQGKLRTGIQDQMLQDSAARSL